MPPVKSRNGVVNVSLAGGLNTRDDPRMVQPPQTTIAQNIVYPGSNIRKKAGVSLVASPPWATGAAQVVGATNDEIIALDSSGSLYARTQNKFLQKGYTPRFQIQTEPMYSVSPRVNNLSGAATGAYAPTMRNGGHAIIGNIGIAVSEDAAGEQTGASTVFIHCFDNTTRKVLWSTSTRGYVPLPSGSNAYMAYGFSSTASWNYSFTGANPEFAATAPTVVAFYNYFVISMLVFVTGTYTDTLGGAGTVSGAWSVLSHYYFFCDGTNTPAPISIQSGIATNCSVKPHPTAQPWYMAFTGGAEFGFLHCTHFYDVSPDNSNQYLFVSSMGRNLSAAPAVYQSTLAGTTNTAVVNSVTTAGGFPATNATVNSLRTGGPPSPVALVPYATTAANTTRVAWVTPWAVNILDSAAAFAGTTRAMPSLSVPTSPITAAWDGTNLYVYAYPVVVTFPMSGGLLLAYTSQTLFFPTGVYLDYLQTPFLYNFSSTFVAYKPSPLASRAFYLNDVNGNRVPFAFFHQQGPSGIDGGVVAFALTATTNSFSHAYYLRFHSPNVLIKHAASVSTRNFSKEATALFPLQYNAPATGSISYVATTLTNAVPANTQLARVPQGTLLTGGMTTYYDGAIVLVGYKHVPPLSTENFSDVAAGSMPVVAHSYIILWQQQDAYGNMVYSSPSTAVSYTPSTTNRAIRLTNIAGPATDYPDQACIAIYRNLPTRDPLLYKRVGVLPSGSGGTFTDNNSDVSIEGNPPLYAQPNGGELPNDPPPASTFAVASKQRILLASAEVPYQVWPSKPFYPGRAPEFSLNNVLDIDPSSGAIAGLAILDDNFIVFKKDRVILLNGPGPDATGQGAFNPPTNISIDSGCTDPGSILSTSEGVFFRSARGLNLLTRALQVVYIGQPIEGILDNTTITSSCIVPYNSQLRFACADGNILTYDYTSKAWSVLKHNIFAGSPATYVNSMAMSPDQKTLFATTQQVGTTSGAGYAHTEVIQGTPVYSDNGNAVTWTAQTGTLDVSGPMGFGRVRRVNIVGQLTAVPATLDVTFTYDHDPATAQTVSYTFAAGTYSAGQSVDLRVRSPRQKCRAVQVRCSSSSTTDSLIISGLNIEIVASSQALRAPDTRSS